ncbi:glutathione S-transferase [Pterulicium gracile]|uniref:glutathione transferase n=1 Tax=Pterulicium gracile TaxID=1884261 RepID=A0A5C3QNK8_9AGAR|nr:glutathione S-transferase [Pterula gracilis]
MVYTLYGVPKSPMTKRAALYFHEKQVPFKFVPIDFHAGEHKSDEFLAKQPFGQTPYLDDEGFALFETRAIGRYIASKHAGQGTPLIPTGEKEIAKFEEAMSIETSNFDVHAYGAIAEGVYKHLLSKGAGDPDPTIVKGFMDTLGTKLDAYDKILSKQKYLAGDSVTLADLNHLSYGSMFPLLKQDTLDNPSRPNVARWWKELEGRSAWQAVKDGVTGGRETY